MLWVTPMDGIRAVLEYGQTEILPPLGAISVRPARLCRPGRHASRAYPRGKPGFSTCESEFGRETDSPLEGAGFEPSVPRQKDLCKRSPPIAGTGGVGPREMGNMPMCHSLLHHSKRVEGFRDAAGENSGCEVALQVLGSLPVTSSRPFIGEPR